MTRQTQVMRFLAATLFAAIVVLVSSTPASADTTSLVGKPAPDFSLTTLDGKVAKLSAQKGKVVVISFWQSPDATDRENLPYIQQFSANKDWASKGLVVWAIAIDSAQQMAATGRKLLKDSNYTFDVPYDGTHAAFRSYLASSTPTTVVIGSDGIIKYATVAFEDANTPHAIAAAIERALAESGKLDASAWIGKPAPAFLLTAPNGAAIHLDGIVPGAADYDEKYSGKVLLITFWADRNASESILPHIQELAATKDYVRRGLVVMAVATGGQTPADVRKFMSDNRYTFAVPFVTAFASWEDSLGKQMATFVIGRKGAVTGVFAGGGLGETKRIDDAVASALDERIEYRDMSVSIIGKPAPDFSLTTLDGKTVRLSDQRGKVVLLDFWATWCAPCQVSLPHTQALSENRDFVNKGLVVWGITEPDSKQSLADARRYVVSHKFSFTVLGDPEMTVGQAYGISGIPRFVVVGRDGLIKTWGGVFDERRQFLPKRIDDAIASALAEPPPAVASKVLPTPPSAPSSPTNPVPSSPPTPPLNGPLAAVWQRDDYGGQTFRFKLDGDAIDVYGGQELLGVLEAKKNKGEIEMYEGQVRLAPVAHCPGGRSLMQIKRWNENRLDAKIETPLRSSAGITCGGLLGSGKFIRWQQVTLVKR
jgi:peroxiredoxin